MARVAQMTGIGCPVIGKTYYYNCMPLVAQMLVMVAHMAMNAKMNGKELPH